MNLIIPAFCVVSMLSLSVHAQDKIYRNNGNVINAKIIEIGSSELKYKEFDNPNGPIFILETDRVKKVQFETGQVQVFQNSIDDPELYVNDKKNALKINFFSPLYGYSEIGWERSLKTGRSVELSLGVIGAGKTGNFDIYDNNGNNIKKSPFGAFVSAGYKYGHLPSFFIFGKTKLNHTMQGSYVKPTIYLGYYGENQLRYDYTTGQSYALDKQKVFFSALILEFGKQWVFDNSFLMNVYFGVGYGIDNKKQSVQDYYDDNSTAYNYAVSRAGTSPGFSVSFGLKLGLLYWTPKEAKNRNK